MPHRLHVVEREVIGRDRRGPLPSAQIFSFDQVGADALDLVQDVMLSRQPDGHHQNQRGGADHHAQRGQRKTHPVLAEGINRHHGDLAHLGAIGHGPQLAWVEHARVELAWIELAWVEDAHVHASMLTRLQPSRKSPPWVKGR